MDYCHEYESLYFYAILKFSSGFSFLFPSEWWDGLLEWYGEGGGSKGRVIGLRWIMEGGSGMSGNNVGWWLKLKMSIRIIYSNIKLKLQPLIGNFIENPNSSSNLMSDKCILWHFKDETSFWTTNKSRYFWNMDNIFYGSWVTV